ncbi:potassium transporter TrkG [Pseudooceanicola aestuarii]|uniref:potassium transporter TrkG n=1 Tax=Pseudooceanicola aestuarii TaxID=2697319 RepID=UPI001EF7A832|nr:potassium transporter TrkG [Pseudooceanicola aestuarii]
MQHPRAEGQPLFLILLGGLSLSMLLPALVGLAREDFVSARAFFYTAILGAALAGVVALARGRHRVVRHGRADLNGLLSLLAAFVVLPAGLAIPVWEILPALPFLDAYAEMVSAFTTTGMVFLPKDPQTPMALDLWRAQVGWMGGFVIWVSAAAVMAPLSLGGFEVTSVAAQMSGDPAVQRFQRAALYRRVLLGARTLGPIYGGLTALLWLALILLGDRPLVAVSHAMSVMSTSGITPLGAPPPGAAAGSGVPGEMAMALFLVFAISRLAFTSDTDGSRTGLLRDPEFRMGMMIVLAVPLALFLRHWLAVIEGAGDQSILHMLRALWAALFTALSFLTTFGFEAQDWGAMRSWSGLETPGLILMGLAMTGGGVATTAGGVKLLRVYALYLNGMREMERLVYPHSVSGRAVSRGRIRRRGAFPAWISFMLFAMTLALGTAVFALLGSDFEQATVLSVAGLSNTGALLASGAAEAIHADALPAGAKAVACAVMVLGRLELLAIIALFNPNLWRD